jgi:hypothetical protein
MGEEGDRHAGPWWQNPPLRPERGSGRGWETAGVTALPADERPVDPTPVHTADLPETPLRDRNIPAAAWVEAPAELLRSGDDIDAPLVAYKRRLHGWLLWRAGPARGADARYTAIAADDLRTACTFRLFADGTGSGTGPSGGRHTRFRAWKEDLRDHPR